MFFVFIYVYWCPARFLCQMMLVSLNSNTTGVISGAGTVNPSGAPASPRFLWSSCYSIFSFLCTAVLCRSLFVLLSLLFWALCCLSFCDLRIMINPLVSSNSSNIKWAVIFMIHEKYQHASKEKWWVVLIIYKYNRSWWRVLRFFFVFCWGITHVPCFSCFILRSFVCVQMYPYYTMKMSSH